MRSVTQSVDPSIRAAGDDELDRHDRFQPLCGLLRGPAAGRARRARTGVPKDRSPCSQRHRAPICPSPGRPPLSGPQANRAHLQVVLDPDGALGAPDSRDPAVGTGGRRSAGGDGPARTPLCAANAAGAGGRGCESQTERPPSLGRQVTRCPRGHDPVLPAAPGCTWGSWARGEVRKTYLKPVPKYWKYTR